MMTFKQTIYYLIVLMLFYSCDKNDISTTQKQSFVKFYGQVRSDKGNDVIQLKDGGYAILGTIDTDVRGDDLVLIVTDENGNTINNYAYYGGPFDDEGKKVLEMENGGFLILGNYQNSLGGEHDIYLLRADSRGDTIWTTTLGGSRDDIASDMVFVDSASIVLSGSTQSEGNGGYDMLWQKFDTKGNKLWLGNRTSGLWGDEYGQTIAKIEDGYIIAGSTNSYNTTGTRGLFIVSTTIDGIAEISSNLSSLDQAGDKVIQDITMKESSIYLTGTIYNPFNNSNDILFMRLSENLEIEYWNQLGLEYSDEGKSITFANNKIHILGTVQLSSNNSIIQILQIDPANNATTEFDYGGTGAGLILAESFSITSDGGYIITGIGIQEDNSEIPLLKVKENGGL